MSRLRIIDVEDPVTLTCPRCDWEFANEPDIEPEERTCPNCGFNYADKDQLDVID